MEIRVGDNQEFKFRPHRETLDESMGEEKTFNKQQLLDYLKDRYDLESEPLIKITYTGFDKRIGWDTYLVSMGDARYGWSACGYLNGTWDHE